MQSRVLLSALAFSLVGCGGAVDAGSESNFAFDVTFSSGAPSRVLGDSTRWEYRQNLNGGRPGARDLAIELYTPLQPASGSLDAAVFVHGFGDALTAGLAHPGTYPVDDPNASASFNVEFTTATWYGAGRHGSVRITSATAEDIRGTLDLDFDQVQGVTVIGTGHITGDFTAHHSNQPDWTP
jgi:hypothetical protein